jgi:hypothetical protein
MTKIKTWKQAAKFCEKTYGSYVDWDEGFFICPECDDPIYECDWEDCDDWDVCPVCDFNFAEEA